MAVFGIAYVLIAAEKFDRIAVALGGAGAMVLIGATDAERAFFNRSTGVDWNVIFLLLGMMIIVGVIHRTGLFEFLAITAVKRAGGRPRAVLVYLVLLTAIASALLDNVTTVLLVVPMTLLAARELGVSPLPYILAEVFASNIGGAATLVGDPPNIIIASRAGLTFNDFLLHMLPMVVAVMSAIIPLLLWLFRGQLSNTAADRHRLAQLDPREQLHDLPLLRKSLAVLAVVLLAFLTHSSTHIEPSLIALLGAGLLVLISGLKPADYAGDVEWGTLAFFAGLFVMVGALVSTGALGRFADALSSVVGDDASFAAVGLLLASSLLSGFVDNIPYVASMAPVVSQLSDGMGGSSDVLWWALAFGADFGGNLTIIGASANVVAVSLAAHAGHRISFWQFLRYGAPVTLLSTLLVVPYLLLRY